MRPVLLAFGPFHVFAYGAMIALGGILAFAFLWTRRRAIGLDEEGYWTLVNLILIGGVLGGKLLYFIQYRRFLSFGSGYSVFGALAAVTAVTAVFAVRRGIPALKLFDYIAWMLPFWHAFGRLGCLLAGCCYGKPASSGWGVVFRDPRSLVPKELLGVPLYPTQLLEAAGDALIAACLWPLLRATELGRLRPGLVTAAYFAAYGTLRFAIEGLRGDTLPLAGRLTEGQVLGAAMIALAGATLAWRRRCIQPC